MVYFNYYFYKKLIKTFINFLFIFFKKHKKILIFLLLFISYLLISNKCFGFNVEYDDVIYNIPDLPFSVEEHPQYVFGTMGTTEFGVGYPASDVANDRFYFTNTNVVRYKKYGTTKDGEWYWYDLERPINRCYYWYLV